MKQINFKINTAFYFTFNHIKTLKVIEKDDLIQPCCVGPKLLFPNTEEKELENIYYLKCKEDDLNDYLDLLRSLQSVSDVYVAPEREAI